MSKHHPFELRLEQLRKRREKLSRKWYQATRSNHGEASELRRQIVSIDQEIDALESQQPQAD